MIAADSPIVLKIPGKVKAFHLERLAVVYVRQSSQQQVLEHRESAALQYALRNGAEITSRNGVWPISSLCGPEVRDFWRMPWKATGCKSSG